MEDMNMAEQLWKRRNSKHTKARTETQKREDSMVL